MKSISKKILLLVSLLFVVGLITYTDMTLDKGTSGSQGQTFYFRNVVTFPMVDFASVDAGTSFANGKFNMGTLTDIGVKMKGRLRINVTTSETSPDLGAVATNSVGIKIDTPTLTLTKAATGETVTFNVGLSPNLINSFSGISSTQITAVSSSAPSYSAIVGSQVGSQTFYAYMYFESQNIIDYVNMTNGTYTSASAVTVSAIYN